VLGRSTEAEHFLRSAINSCSAAGAQPWIAQAQVDLADLLIETDASSTEALNLANAALSTARSLSIVPVLESAKSILSSRSTPAADDVVEHTPPLAHPTISVLGTFAVIGANGTAASWTSRKARELLKLIVARQGRAVLREEAIDALWPGSSSPDAANRLSVALSTIRRALDPAREHAADAFIVADRAGIALRADAVAVDLTLFRDRARQLGITETRTRAREVDVHELRSLLEWYAGDAFADEPYADWAWGVRDSTRSLFVAAAHEFVALCESSADDLGVVAMCNRILEADPFDEPAHRSMIEALERLGAHGRATHARGVYRARLAELGIDSRETSTGAAQIRRSAF
jgi:two-component SAPR family response regulator